MGQAAGGCGWGMPRSLGGWLHYHGNNTLCTALQLGHGAGRWLRLVGCGQWGIWVLKAFHIPGPRPFRYLPPDLWPCQPQALCMLRTLLPWQANGIKFVSLAGGTAAARQAALDAFLHEPSTTVLLMLMSESQGSFTCLSAAW